MHSTAREEKIRVLIPACAVGIFLGRVIPVTYKLALQSLPCQAPGVKGSALGPVSIKLFMGEVVSFSCNLYLSVAVRTLV